MDPEAKLRQLGLTLPEPPKPFGAYRAVVRSGNLLHLSGQGPVRDGRILITGKVGEGEGASVSLEQARQAALDTMLVTLAAVKAHLGSLAPVRQVVKCNVYVASAPGFTDHPAVADAATELLRELWGDQGLPARAAVGVAELPKGIPVEIETTFEVA